MNNELERLAQSLPQAEPVKVPYSTYVEVVKEALRRGDCILCCVCGEPRWYDQVSRSYSHFACFAVSSYYNKVIELD
jgi:hypothetical protein